MREQGNAPAHERRPQRGLGQKTVNAELHGRTPEKIRPQSSPQ